MAIDPAEVMRIARLARLSIEEAEAEHLARDLARIVEHVDSLSQVQLDENAEALTYFDRDVHREDRVGECLDREAALYNAPDSDGEHFLVPQIVDRDEE